MREIHIPASVESIGDYAFTWNLNLQGITMDSGNKVYNIPANSNVIMRGDSVVFGWQGAVIPENAVAIGNGAFNSVKGITSITIPASVTSIGEWAFEACSDLTEIYCLSETPARIYSTTFQGLYDTVTLYVPAIGKNEYAGVSYWKNFANIVEEPNDLTGDVDGDGTVDVADATTLVSMILDNSLVNIILFGNNESDDTAGETIGIPQDLGLSVKWASYNVGAIAAWESGDYYAWGETEEKEEYSQNTYKFNGDSRFGQFTKYYYDNMLGLGGDGKTKLDSEDDVARVKWGGSWRMPTNGELDELRDNCTWEWETLYGVKGYRVTGPNGNSIFLPAVGFRTGTEINSQQKIYYWSSTVYVIGGYTDAYIIDETYAGDDYFFDAVCGRHCGLPVRPVCE